MQKYKCIEAENAFPIIKVSRLVKVHTDSHHNDFCCFIRVINNKMTRKVHESDCAVAVSDCERSHR